MSSSETAKPVGFKRWWPILVVPAAAAILYVGHLADRMTNAMDLMSDPEGRAIAREALAFDQKMAEFDLGAIMDPEALQADPGMRRTRAKLAERRRVIEAYRVHVAAVPTIEQKEVLEMLDLDLALTAEVDAVADLLAGAEGRWRAGADFLVFDRPADQAALNGRIRNMQSLLARQDAVRARALASGAVPIEDIGAPRR